MNVITTNIVIFKTVQSIRIKIYSPGKIKFTFQVNGSIFDLLYHNGHRFKND